MATLVRDARLGFRPCHYVICHICRWLCCPLIRGRGTIRYQAYPSIMRDCLGVCRGIRHTTFRGFSDPFLIVLLPKVIFGVRSDSHIR